VQTLSVNLDDRSYPIHIGSQILCDSDRLSGLLSLAIKGKQVALFTNSLVNNLYGSAVYQALSGYSVDVFEMGDGEAHKSLDTYNQAINFLMEKRHNRTTCLIALGGGVVGDLTGFVAATYQRGVDFIQIPTTLLAQVDSSVGGKTAVNHSRGKNMIGAFHQPKKVVIDIDCLSSLPTRQYAAGLAEVVKYGIIADAKFFAFLEEHRQGLMDKDEQILAQIIMRSCEIKSEVVAADEKESGVRAVLNYGHTFAHAIENLTGYGEWLHGEAVSIGMVMATDFSERSYLLPQGARLRVERLLEDLGLPIALREPLSAEKMLQAMGMDKKTTDGQLRLVVADAIGEARITGDFDADLLKAVLSEYCE